MTPPTLLAVPNVSEGRDADTIAAIGAAFAGGDVPDGVRVLDVHSDPDHNRSVFTLAGHPASWWTRSCAARAWPSSGST